MPEAPLGISRDPRFPDSPIGEARAALWGAILLACDIQKRSPLLLWGERRTRLEEASLRSVQRELGNYTLITAAVGNSRNL